MSGCDWTPAETAKDAAILARRAANLLGRGLEEDIGLLEVLFQFRVDGVCCFHATVGGGGRGQVRSCEEDASSGVDHVKCEGRWEGGRIQTVHPELRWQIVYPGL